MTSTVILKQSKKNKPDTQDKNIEITRVNPNNKSQSENNNDLNNYMVTFSYPLEPGKQTKISFDKEQKIHELLVEITLENKNIPHKKEGSHIIFTPKTTGNYTLTLQKNDRKRSIYFYIRERLPYGDDDIQILNHTTENDQALGFIRNQYWIYSQTLSATDLKKKVKQHSTLAIIGFDEFNGLLVQLDHDSTDDLHALEAISRSPDIDYVTQRLYEGEDYNRLEQSQEAVYTNDYESWHKDARDNWHLTKINMPKAWAITQGSSKTLVGISDGGFDTKHEELEKKIIINRSLPSHKIEKTHIDHGTAVAGVIAAKSHNDHGVSGINFNAKLIVSGAGMREWSALAHHKNIKVISASWALTHHLSTSFDPDNGKEAAERAQKAFRLTRQFRKMAQLHPDKLFIFSAGNGIGNGTGNKGHYAVEGELHSPALHLSTQNTIDKVANVIFVGALTHARKLSYNSTYGPLVDIAAPSYYKSLASEGAFKTNSHGKYGLSGGFKGTSAAAPVVAGVASLIYGINDQFSGAEVKEILLTATREQVTSRFSNPQYQATDLAYPLPVLDAFEAVKKAKQRARDKIKFTLSLPNPYEPAVYISLKQRQNKISTIEIVDGTALETSEEHNQTKVNIDAIETIDHIKITIEDEGGDTESSSIDAKINVAKVALSVNASDTLDAIADVTITLDAINKPTRLPSGVTNSEGKSALYLLPGSYKLTTQVADFHPSTRLIHLSDNENLAINLTMTPIGLDEVGSIEGTLFDLDDNPIEGAKVTVNAKHAIKPIERSTITDANGYYTLHNIPSLDKEDKILSYRLTLSAEGFSSKSTYPIIVMTGQTLQRNQQLFTVEHHNRDDEEEE